VFEVQILTGNFTKVRIYSVETPFLIRRRNSHARTSLDSKTRELERDSSYSSRSRQARSASQELLRSNQRTEARSLCPTSQTKPKHREQPNLPARDKRTTVATTTLTGTVTSTGSILRLPTLDNLAGRSEQRRGSCSQRYSRKENLSDREMSGRKLKA